jgi:hypothetical protein
MRMCEGRNWLLGNNDLPLVDMNEIEKDKE